MVLPKRYLYPQNIQLINIYFGRGGEIRTPDPLVPNQMRYQTALRPDIDVLV